MKISAYHPPQANTIQPLAEAGLEVHRESRPEITKLHHKILQHPLVNVSLAAGDVLSATSDFIKIPDGLKAAVDKYSVLLTKGAMIGRYLDSAAEAFQANRIVESAGRLMGVAALPLVKLNDLTLASGLGEFIPQLDLGLEGKVKKKTEELTGEGVPSKSQNLKIWLSSLKEAYGEILTGGLGENRKIFPKDKDTGHTLVLAGTLTFLGASLGMLFGIKSRDLSNKIFGSLRNIGGLIADYTLLTHPDPKMRKTGIVTTLASLVDGIQRFLPEKYLNTVNHLNLLNNMFANQLLTDRTHHKSKDKVQVYDSVSPA